MDRQKEFIEKNNLVTGDDWKRIKTLMLENILALSNTQIEPLILQGMLKTINDTDKWESDFQRELSKRSTQT